MSDSPVVENKTELERHLWDAIDELKNSGLRVSEYLEPILGLFFLHCFELKFNKNKQRYINWEAIKQSTNQADSQIKRGMNLPDESRFSKLLTLSTKEDIGEAINKAMSAIEFQNKELIDALPKNYNLLDNVLLKKLMKNFNSVDLDDFEEDIVGVIYESLLNKFAVAQGKEGNEFITPASLIELMVEITEPYQGKVYDPACGSGGMFIKSARFSKRHQKDSNVEISIFGQDKVAGTVRLCKMNLAVNGLLGDIKHGDAYCEDFHTSVGKFDFVMANPPFNVDNVDKQRLKYNSRAFELGIPQTNNANYIWINLFYSALNEKGRAAFVMPNSASDSKGSELEIRRKLIQTGAVDVIIQLSSNFFYNNTLPCTLWFFDKEKVISKRKDKILFVDARQTYQQINRIHRKFSAEQIEYLTSIVKSYRGETVENSFENQTNFQGAFHNGKYLDTPGLCKVATISEIEEQEWSLSPSRYCNAVSKVNLFEFLEQEAQRALAHLEEVSELNDDIVEKVVFVCNARTARAPIRILLSCLVAKLDKPLIDIRKPYLSENNLQSYSGRTYDEIYISSFISKYRLPCNSSTAFLSSPYRQVREITVEAFGKIKNLKSAKSHETTAELLDLVQINQVSAKELLFEVIRKLFAYRNYWSEAEKRRNQLETCPCGQGDFSQYERIGTEILEYIFSLELERLTTQATTKDGTQRRDVIFLNKEISLFWQRIARKYDACYITVDFKNYQKPITSKVVESVTKYANKLVGNFIIVVSRRGLDKSAVHTQLRILRDRNIVVIVISDENLVQMLELKERNEQPEKVLEDLFNQVIINY